MAKCECHNQRVDLAHFLGTAMGFFRMDVWMSGHWVTIQCQAPASPWGARIDFGLMFIHGSPRNLAKHGGEFPGNQWKYWLVVWNLNGLWLSIYWEFHHPNWLIFFRGVGIPRNMFRFSCNQVDLGNLGKLRCVWTKQGKPKKSALVLCHMVVQGNTGAPNKISKAYTLW